MHDIVAQRDTAKVKHCRYGNMKSTGDIVSV